MLNFLFILLSFFLPTQLSYHLKFFSQPVYGFQIDYLIPTFYLTDIIVLGILACWLIKRKFRVSRKTSAYIILYLSFALINTYLAVFRMAAIYKWVKLTEFVLLGIILSSYKKLKIFENFVKPLSYSITIACLLGIWQWIKKGSIGGIFYWLGERQFNFSDPGISPHPYSFFSHPNSFAGFLLVYSLFLINFRNKFNKPYFSILSVLIIINLILTNSLNVYLVALALIVVKFFRKGTFSLLVLDFTSRTVTHRLELIKASWQLIKENFFFGVGINNFIPRLTGVSNKFLNSWELQPVHNIFLLVFSELGVVGLITFLFLLSNLDFNLPVIAILLTGLSDHYWLTLQQNMLLFTFVLSLSVKNRKR